MNLSPSQEILTHSLPQNNDQDDDNLKSQAIGLSLSNGDNRDDFDKSLESNNQTASNQFQRIEEQAQMQANAPRQL